MTYRIYVSNALCQLLMIYFIWKYIVNKEVKKIINVAENYQYCYMYKNLSAADIYRYEERYNDFDFELSMNIQSKTSLKHKNTKKDNSKFQSSTRMNQIFFRNTDLNCL